MRAWSLLLGLVVGLAGGCAARRAPFAGFIGADNPRVEDGSVRLVLIGDTGALPDGEDGHIDAETFARLEASVAAEQADGIFALGDLVYGVGGPLELVPLCEEVRRRKVVRLLDGRIGDYFDGMEAPVWLVLGNHDVGHYTYSRQRARCLMAYAALRDQIHMPGSRYVVDYGLLRVAVVDTNVPPKRWDPEEVRAALGAEPGQWSIMAGHHVLRTFFDKEDEQVRLAYRYRDWLAAHQIRPDLWVNGHSHLLQFGVYDGIPAVTSGAGSKLRPRTECPGDACLGEDVPAFSRSTFGYAVVDAYPDWLVVRFKDADGKQLWCWRRTHEDPIGEACPGEPTEDIGPGSAP